MDPKHVLDPEIAELMNKLPRMAPIAFDRIQAARDQRAAAQVQPVLSDAVERTDYHVSGPKDSPDVLVRVHRPRSAKGQLPCAYWIHGGGYIVGSVALDDARFDAWCQSHNLVGVSVDYRLAPETPYPGPLEDAYAGLKWVHEHAAEIGVDPSRIGIGGQSAGGGLAAGLALLVRDRGEIPITFQLLIYPMIDDRRITASSRWDVPAWPPLSNETGWKAYLGPLFETDDVPVYAAPARAVDLAGLPPAFVNVGTLDGFLDEDVDYAMRMIRSGVPVELHVYPGAPHGFDSAYLSTRLAQQSRRDMEDWLRRVL